MSNKRENKGINVDEMLAGIDLGSLKIDELEETVVDQMDESAEESEYEPAEEEPVVEEEPEDDDTEHDPEEEEPVVEEEPEDDDIEHDPEEEEPIIKQEETVVNTTEDKPKRTKKTAPKTKQQTKVAFKEQPAEENDNAEKEVPKTAQTTRPPRQRKIHTITKERRVETPNDRRLKEELDLSEAMYTKKILMGVINNCEPYGDEGQYAGIVLYGSGSGTRVVIPIEELLDLPEPVMRDKNGKELYQVSRKVDALVTKQEFINMEIKKRVGMEIDYVVTTSVRNGGRTEYGGSRIAAMKMQRRRTYYPDRNGNIGILEGDDAEARVVAVGDRSIMVEIGGVETLIPAEELTFKHASSFRPKFVAGDIVLCRVLKIEKSGYNSANVEITASVKACLEEPVKADLETFKVGGTYRGFVELIFKKGIFVEISENIECYCLFPNRLERPVDKQIVTIRIDEIDLNKLKLKGSIIELHNVKKVG